MRKLLMSVSLVALTAPAFAADPIVYVEEPILAAPSVERFSGHIEGYLGGVWFDADFADETENGWIFGGAARANYALTDRWNVQGDLFGESLRIDGSNFDTLGAGGHVFWRDPNSFAAGVFASVSSVGSLFGIREYVVGPEAQVYFDNLTLYGQLYYGKLDAEEFPIDADIWGARGVARYFLHDNFKVEGEVGYRTLDFGEGDLDQWTLAAQADYRFDNTPFSVFGRYQFDNYSGDGEGDLNSHKLLVGFRGTFGADTLKAEDRFGATMDLPQGGLPLGPIGIGGPL